MTKSDSLRRVFFTVGVLLLLADSAFAQSVLNFASTIVQNGSQARISVTNPTPHYADVEFTLYGAAGDRVTAGVLNPVRYRIKPKGQFSMFAGDIFAGSNLTGWIQAVSSTSGLQGFYYSGDFQSRLEGAPAASPLAHQIIPFVRVDGGHDTEIVVVNTNAVEASFTLTLIDFNGSGVYSVSHSLPPHAAIQFNPAAAISAGVPGVFSARIDSSAPVAATAVVSTNTSMLFVPGQKADQLPVSRRAPHFVSGAGQASLLVLNNPSGSSVSATVSVFSGAGNADLPSGALLSSIDTSIPAYGSILVEPAALVGSVFAPLIDGWVQIDSPDAGLAGIVIFDQVGSLTAIPLEEARSTQMLYSQILETETTYSSLALVNPSPDTAQVDLYRVTGDGVTVATRRIELPGTTKLAAGIGELIPARNDDGAGFVVIKSSHPIHGLGLQGSAGFLAAVSGTDLPGTFQPDFVRPLPTIDQVQPGVSIRAGMILQITASNLGTEVVFLLNGRVVPAQPISAAVPTFAVQVPNIEPGFVRLSLRSDGEESAPVTLFLQPPDNIQMQILSGSAFYQKIDVTDSGLDLTRVAMAPIRNARIEVFDRSVEAVVSSTTTDAYGRFLVPVPFGPSLTVRVQSQLRSGELIVADNTNGNAVYTISQEIDGRTPNLNLLLADRSRTSGAFNLLEVIQRGNDVLRLLDSRITLPAVRIFWSPRNTRTNGNVSEGLIGTTFFSLNGGTAYVLGDRNVDSDEFDDSVVLHEYGHLLAARFSRDDSPGREHGIGDILDPRVAWSEGWANFFSSVVRNDAIYRDSLGLNGAGVAGFNLEENVPAGDWPGYSSEASVHSLLWDLYDGREDAADSVQFSLALIWSAFQGLRDGRFVYLPAFLERFLALAPESAGVLREMVLLRSIDFQPGVRPSVTNPFPRPINVGETITGVVDSLSLRRSNLAQSAHFQSFTTAGGDASIRLDIIGLGPAGNGAANDLDLFLLDMNGRVMARSDRGLHGQSELISMRLSAGTYVVEVRSFYIDAATNELVFNSGQYRLSVLIQ